MKKYIVVLMVMLMMIFSCSCSDREKSKDTVVKASNSFKKEVPTENIASDIKHEINIEKEIFNLDSIINIEKLRSLDKKELSILRNAIYAKYGYIFTSSKYKEYFSQIQWYQPKLKDVSNMLTEIDIKNIDSIVEVEKVLEKRNESSKVFETTIASKDKSYSYKVEFFLQEDVKERNDQTFNQFKIYKINDDNMKMIFNSEVVNDENMDEIISVANTASDILSIEDKDKDGMDEIFFALEDILGYKTILVIESINDKYIPSFYGYEFEELKYKDVNEDGVMELINDHPGGGGYVSTWTGLDLVNELQGEKYNFSFDLTKQYYEKIKNEREALFETSPTPECFVKLLNAYADLGMAEKCTDLINEHSELVNSKEYDYSKHNDSPAETFFDYVVVRAGYYISIWNEMKSWNTELESEKNSNTLGNIDTQESLDVAEVTHIPQQYIDFMKEKDGKNDIAFYAKEDIDLDGNDEVIVAACSVGGYDISSIYVLRENGGIIQQLGENLAEGGYGVCKVKLIELQNMQKKYIYCGLTNGAGMRGFKIYELIDDQPNVICYSASATGAGDDQLKDFDNDGIYDGYIQNRYSYDVLYYSLSHTYVWQEDKFILNNTHVDIPEYPDNIKDILIQYMCLRALDNGKAPNIDKRLSELCIYDKANNIDFSSDVWFSALSNTVMEMDNMVKWEIEEKINTATATAVYVDDSHKKYTLTFHLKKIDNKWCIDNII